MEYTGRDVLDIDEFEIISRLVKYEQMEKDTLKVDEI